MISEEWKDGCFSLCTLLITPVLQFIEQAPGPLGSPQVPHPPRLPSNPKSAPPPLTAKVDSCFSMFGVSHSGHMMIVEPWVINSK